MTTNLNENYQRRFSLPIVGSVTIRDLSLAAGVAFGVLGILLTVVSIFLTLREPEARVTFKIISATDVLDLRRSLDDLRIEFRGQDLKEQNLNLKVVRISVENSGETHIRAGDYSNVDWGINVVDGQVIEVKVDRSDAANLISTNDLRYVGSDSIAFPKIVFDKGDTFAIELLVLHANGVEPVVVPIGKIAGVKSFDLAPPPVPGTEVGFLGKTFGGSVSVLALRSGSYFVGSVIVLITIALGLVAGTVMVDDMKERRRKKRAAQSVAIRGIDSVSIRDSLIELYGSAGNAGLRRLSYIMKDLSGVRWMNHSEEWLILDRHHGPDDDSESLSSGIGDRMVFSKARDALLAMRALERGENNEPVIDVNLIDAVETLAAELEDPKR